MPHPPNHTNIVSRDPKHGIHIAGASPSHTKHTTSAASRSTVTVHCVTASCPNTVAVVPFGHHHRETIDIKVTCKECYVPIVFAPLEKAEDEQETWEESTGEDGGDGYGDGEEW